MPTLRSRYRGALLGLAMGDALGTTLEFRPPGSFTPIDDLVGGGPFDLAPGQWTDDTSMALCLAASLIARKEFDPLDQLRRYTAWYKEGYMSCTGSCFDIGNTVRKALERFARTGEPYCGTEDPWAAGNGSIMRLAPVPLCFAATPEEAIHYAALSAKTTHAAREAVDACRYLAALILGALGGRSKEEILSPRFSPVPGLWEREPLAPRIDEVAAGSFKEKNPPAIRGSGYVVESLEAALWAFYHGKDFREGALLAVNLGDDADTTGAVYGQLAGAYYGEEGLPPEWLAKLAWRDRIVAMADELHALATTRCRG